MQHPSNTSRLAFRFLLGFWLRLFQFLPINKCVCKTRLILSVIFKKKKIDALGWNVQSQENLEHYKICCRHFDVCSGDTVLSEAILKSR